jgi:uncharacterized protein (DUF1800 family)
MPTEGATASLSLLKVRRGARHGQGGGLPLNELARVARKIGLGFRPEDDRSLSPRDWVEEQLSHPPSNRALVALDSPRREVAEWPADLTYDLDTRIRRIQVKRRREDEIDETAPSEAERVRLREELIKELDVKHIDVCRFVQRASWGNDQVRQRLAHFWLNHFTVGAKDQTPELIGDYWDGIAGALDGSFSDLAYRATTHPAMLSYLDNTNNVGPRSRHARGCKCGKPSSDNDPAPGAYAQSKQEATIQRRRQ